MLRKPHDQYWDTLIGKMSGSGAQVEAPKGSVARVLRRESSSTTQGKPCIGVGVGSGAIRRRDRLKTREQTGCEPVSISTQSSRGVWGGNGDHVPCGREPRRLDGWTLFHRHVGRSLCFGMRCMLHKRSKVSACTSLVALRCLGKTGRSPACLFDLVSMALEH